MKTTRLMHVGSIRLRDLLDFLSISFFIDEGKNRQSDSTNIFCLDAKEVAFYIWTDKEHDKSNFVRKNMGKGEIWRRRKEKIGW